MILTFQQFELAGAKLIAEAMGQRHWPCMGAAGGIMASYMLEKYAESTHPLIVGSVGDKFLDAGDASMINVMIEKLGGRHVVAASGAGITVRVAIEALLRALEGMGLDPEFIALLRKWFEMFL